ncbi:MAG: cell division protein FtsQ/DivIB [Planctomycetota bacterium]|jgi:hypothetical protein
MTARKKKAGSKPNSLRARWKRFFESLQSRRRGLVLSTLIVVGFIALWCVVWREVGQQILLTDRYWLLQGNVEMTPQPGWIGGDVRDEVFRASLDGPLSIMEDDLTLRIANAFSLHPWIERVRRVTKHHPARVTVEVDYRRPACAVQVRGRSSLLVVDEQGVLLPGDVVPTEVRRFPRLEGIDTVPIGPEGTRWGDDRVSGAARIAAAFGPAWEELGLDCIVPLRLVDASHVDGYAYRLITRDGRPIIWGRSSETDAPDEPSAADKVAWLLEFQKSHGTLEDPGGTTSLDLRHVAGQRVSRTDAEAQSTQRR